MILNQNGPARLIPITNPTNHMEQPFAPLRLGRPGGSSSGAADAGAGAGSWAAIRRLGISAPNSTTPGAAPASAFGAGFGGPEAPAAGGVLAGGVLPRTSLFAVARAHSSGSSALHPRSTAGEAETPSPRLARGHGRGSGSGSSGGGGLTRSLSDPCLHSPTAASTAGSLSAAAHSGSGGSWGPAPSGDGDVAAGASGSTPTGHSFFRAGPDALRHAGEGGGGGVMGLGGPSPGVMQDDADVDYSLINSMLGRLHFASRARCCRDTPQQQQQEQQPPERLAPGLQRGAGEAAGGLGRSRQQQPANKKGD